VLQSDDISRRRLLKRLVGFAAVSTLGMIAYPILRFLVPPSKSGDAGGGTVSVGTTADIPIGAAKVVPVAGKPVIVVNTEQGVHAFSAICTHLGCIVAWDAPTQTIACPCHDGRFNPATGAVISGPPPSPLPPLTATIEDDEIFVLVS
jgi:cytochrome b6-f complex iron-sulfur subunit